MNGCNQTVERSVGYNSIVVSQWGL